MKYTICQTEHGHRKEVCSTVDSVNKDNFGEFESTEWSIVYNQSSGKVCYYHRENYKKVYTFYVE